MANELTSWVSVTPDTGIIKVKKDMDRESNLVKDGKYTAIILAEDNDGNFSFFFKSRLLAGMAFF